MKELKMGFEIMCQGCGDFIGIVSETIQQNEIVSEHKIAWQNQRFMPYERADCKKCGRNFIKDLQSATLSGD